MRQDQARTVWLFIMHAEIGGRNPTKSIHKTTINNSRETLLDVYF
jgi:hypothetical protein